MTDHSDNDTGRAFDLDDLLTVHESDQRAMAFSTLAAMYWDYYRALHKAGFSQVQAMQLTIAFQAASFQTNRKRDDR